MFENLTTNQKLINILAELEALEISLHFPKRSAVVNDLENMMAASFWEVGASGRCYDKEFVLACLAERAQQQPTAEFSDFLCSQIEGNSYLLTYTQKEPKRITRRSAIWQYTDNGWKNLYHQGTPVSE